MRILLTIILATITIIGFTQAPPQGINYQAVVYDVDGSQMPGVDATDLVLANKDISVRFSIIFNSSNGTELYKETHQTTTDEYGLFSLVIGQGNQVSTNSFSQIDWGAGLHFLKVEIDKTGGTNYITLSNQQLWSVPYALYSGKSGNGIENVTDNGDGTLTFTYADSTQLTVGPLGWSLYGNPNTDEQNNFLGTTDLHDLIFKTNGAERMRISKNGLVGINAPNTDQSAILELRSLDKGFLLPRLTTAERDFINAPATGLVIYNREDSVIQFFNGECWLPTYAQSCEDCFFDLSLPVISGTIDRVTTDTIAIVINVDQTSSPDQTISFFLLENLPEFTTTYFTADTVNGDGTTTLVVSTSIFDEPGLYPIAIQAVCGNSVQTEVFYLTIDSCYQVTISNSTNQYNLQSINSLPGAGTPICVVVDVTSTGLLSSGNSTTPTFTSGALDPLSHVGIRNYGAFLSRGGDGGVGGNFGSFGNTGGNGGTAINMTCKTTLLNYGYIFGGGGGGASVGLSQSFNIPLIGTWTLAIGAGGGGGCALGSGGGTGGNLIGFWDDGANATGGLGAVPGQGGVINVPIPIPLGPVTINLNPNVQGGDGGNYGLQGNSGSLTINASATVPIIGTINIPIPSIGSFPAGGNAGYAVKKNGNILNGINDGNYQLNNLKGIVNN